MLDSILLQNVDDSKIVLRLGEELRERSPVRSEDIFILFDDRVNRSVCGVVLLFDLNGG